MGNPAVKFLRTRPRASPAPQSINPGEDSFSSRFLTLPIPETMGADWGLTVSKTAYVALSEWKPKYSSETGPYEFKCMQVSVSGTVSLITTSKKKKKEKKSVNSNVTVSWTVGQWAEWRNSAPVTTNITQPSRGWFMMKSSMRTAVGMWQVGGGFFERKVGWQIIK